MNVKSLKAVLFALSLFTLIVGAQAQSQKKDTIVTKGKLVIAKLKVGEGEAIDVRGKATFTFTAANSDGSFAGTVSYALPDDARQKIAQLSGKPLNQVPAAITQTDVVAELQKLTECPVIHLDFKPMDLVVAGAKVHFNRFTLDVNDDGREINVMVCKIASQTLVGRAIRGPVRRINEIINGVDPQ